MTYLVESFQRGRIHRPQAVYALPGGKALNVARALALLGAPARVVAPLGGHTGARVRDGLAAVGVPLDAVPVGVETRACVSIVDEDSGRTTEVYEEPAALVPDEERALAAAVRAARTGWVAVSGSMTGTVAAALAGALAGRGGGVRVALDTHGAPLDLLVGALAPDVVKVNRAEAAALVGHAEPAELCARLRALGPATAVVTDGPRGSWVADAGGAFRVLGPTGGHYTVGSGDCFLAGLLAALDTGAPLREAAAAATATAVANTYVPGAARFERADVEAAARRVVVEPLG